MRTSSSQAEGAKRDFAVLTKKFSGDRRQGAELHCVQVDDNSSRSPAPNSNSTRELVLLAMGFVHPVHEGMLKNLGVDLDQRGNVRADMADYRPRCPTSSPPATCAAGSRWWCGRSARAACARAAIDQFLMGSTTLPR